MAAIQAAFQYALELLCPVCHWSVTLSIFCTAQWMDNKGPRTPEQNLWSFVACSVLGIKSTSAQRAASLQVID